MLIKLDTQSVMVMCSDVTNQFRSIRPELVGITLISGFVVGKCIAGAVDRYSSERKDFQNRWKYLIGAGVTILTFAGTTLVSLSGKINAKTAILFGALSSGVILGIKIQEYYNKNSDQKINDFLQGLKPSDRGSVVEASLSLSGYRECWNYFNVTKLGKKIDEAFQADSNLQLLDLSDTDLTDDTLREMAQTDLFNNVSRLCLSNNPRLTGKGIAWIAEKGFAGLKRLDLSYNQQIIKTGLDEWVGKSGFKKLTSLNLAATGIRENELEAMIERAEWFRELKGLNLDWNNKLVKFPSNISRLTNLDKHSVSDSQLISGGSIHFRGAGLFCRGCKNLICTQELLNLANDGKVFGKTNNHPFNLK